MSRFFFAKDGYGHWYLIPVGYRVEWQAWVAKGFDWEDAALMRIFSNFRTGGGIEGYTFTDPKETD